MFTDRPMSRIVALLTAIGLATTACQRKPSPQETAKTPPHPLSTSVAAPSPHPADPAPVPPRPDAVQAPSLQSGSPAPSPNGPAPGTRLPQSAAAMTPAPSPAHAMTPAGTLPADPAARLEVVKDLETRGAVSIPMLSQVLAGEANAIIRGEAARGLGKILLTEGLPPAERRSAIAALTESLLDPDPTVILESAQSLSSAGDSTPVRDLLATLAANRVRQDGYGIPIRMAAIQSLGACGDRGATPALISELMLNEDVSYDNEVVLAMESIGDPAALSAIREHRAQLELRKPTEVIALDPWREAVNIADRTIRKLEQGKE